MNIAGTEVSPKYLTFEVYVAGCTQQCPGCHNKAAWDFAAGVPMDLEWMLETTEVLQPGIDTGFIQRLWVLGGEPLEQPDLHQLLIFLSRFGLPIDLFTSFELKDVPKHIRRYCARIKTGRYDHTCAGAFDHGGIVLASENQRLWVAGEDF